MTSKKRFVNFLAIMSLFATVAGKYSDTFNITKDGNGCTTLVHRFDPLQHKPRYIVGVYTSEGDAAAFRKYNQTFAQYLTATAGLRFDPPIHFDMVPVLLDSLAKKADKEEVDFFFASPSVMSCMATEQKAQPLATIISRREARGHVYELDKYGGVMFTLANNDRVNTIADFKDKTIGAGGITMMGGGQTQLYEMWKAGLSYVSAPLQMVFTGDERKTVDGVLNGDFEIGMARTDQIERHVDGNGEPIDPDTFKVINPQIHVLDDGTLFPFLSSTDLNPEWPVAALGHVSRDVAKVVQEALLDLRDHKTSLELNKNLICYTTPELAELALAATTSGLYVGFRTARSYFEVRSKQENAGFLRKLTSGEMHCIRGETLYHDVHCPEGYYKLAEEDFAKSCSLLGLECKEGYECYCKPCVKAFEVDVYQVHGEPDGDGGADAGDEEDTANTTAETGIREQADVHRDGCDKMSMCGEVEQTKTTHFHIVDNLQRENADVEVAIHLDSDTIYLEAKETKNTPFTYELEWTWKTVGIGIMEVFVNGEQIPQSPVRIQIVDRQCDLDYPGQRRTSTSKGDCACTQGSFEIRGRCVDSTIMAVVISVVVVLFVSILGTCFVRYRTNKNDEMWQVNLDELQFSDPVEVVGQGSFGVVLVGNYRGTKVCVKRAVRLTGKGSKRSGRSARGSRARSKGSNSAGRNNTDSVGLSSGGLSSVDTNEKTSELDAEKGEAIPDEESYSSNESTPAPSQDHQGGSRSRTASYSPHSLGFLAEDFGRGGKWAWLFPWIQKNDYHNRFKESILGTTGSGSYNVKTWHAILCPYFSAQARAEEEFMVEMRVLSRLRHPCVTTVLGAVISRTHDPMLVMEFMEYGSLYDLLQNETMHLSGEIILQVCRDVSQGLRFLHSSKPEILHGDMKAKNILIDSRFRAKLCDFGLSNKKRNLITGTPFWLAPEYLRGQSAYTSMCDIYSMGIILYEIYARKNPYAGEDFRDTLRKICDRRTNKRPNIPETAPPKMVEIMKKCWSPDPLFRPQAKDLDTTFLDWSTRDAEPLTPEDKTPNKMSLYELFPKNVADQLKAGQKVEPEQHEEVTVVFSDIIHFTDISHVLSPLKVSSMLDRLYLAFDKVASKNKVFKVETIGDAYMGVTNLEKDQDDTHAKNAALFAIDLVTEASKVLIDEDDPTKGCINIRVGLNSGPVVSNVIGSLNPRYGLFGDTVNTASRMESNSKANRILCSESTFALLAEQAPEISARKRGKIAVKGKGEMVTYWVGDEEVQSVQVGAMESVGLEQGIDAKRVGFEIPTEDDHVETVDESLWRRDLQNKLEQPEEPSSSKGKAPAKEKKNAEKMRVDKTKNVKKDASPSKKTTKKSVKEAVHIRRGANVV